MFTDYVRITLKAGKGGNGVVSWHRAKYLPKGGPSGGNGGKGGSIFVEASAQLFCLDSFRNARFLRAQNGKDGGTNQCQGKRGENLTIHVPCGTLIKDAETGTLLSDLTEDGERILLCEGGKGGLGNAFFATPTRQTPHFATPGKMGKELSVALELKLIADVGFVGFPNAGKSTLFSHLTRSSSKIGAYPFTTLKPHISFIETKEKQRVFLADIPGIIADAHQNRGLGLDFLRHIERTKHLVFILDASGIDGRNPIDDYLTLQQELNAYNPTLLQRPFHIILNKQDAEEAQQHTEQFLSRFPEKTSHTFLLSATTGEGITPFLQALTQS